jgi:predicted dehydrogenase
MRFALLGNHPDGLDLACALAESGRHQVMAYTTPVSDDVLPRWGPAARRVPDVEEVLADPAIEAVVVASRPSERPVHLRRALQSERHVLCVHPPDDTPEIAYEAAMLQKDSGCLLLPLLPESLHPGIRRLAEFVHRPAPRESGTAFPGVFRLLEIERGATGAVLDGFDGAGRKRTFPGWDVLRSLGGEINEVCGFAEREDPEAADPVFLNGRFETGGLFQVTLLPEQAAPRWRLAVIGTAGRVELLFTLGWPGPAFLEFRDTTGEPREESWESWDPWPALVEVFEAALGQRTGNHGSRGPERERVTLRSHRAPDSASVARPLTIPFTWQDTIRALELDDAARRSIERRRSSLLEYPEANEEVSFKGTMTLAGCGLLWVVLLLLIVSRWVPPAGWLIVPLLLVLFMGVQLLRYLIPQEQSKK